MESMFFHWYFVYFEKLWMALYVQESVNKILYFVSWFNTILILLSVSRLEGTVLGLCMEESVSPLQGTVLGLCTEESVSPLEGTVLGLCTEESASCLVWHWYILGATSVDGLTRMIIDDKCDYLYIVDNLFLSMTCCITYSFIKRMDR